MVRWARLEASGSLLKLLSSVLPRSYLRCAENILPLPQQNALCIQISHLRLEHAGTCKPVLHPWFAVKTNM
jgi:hypothetical protein